MKSTLFNKENFGIINGTLVSSNRIQCDIEGHIKEFLLSGNVRECEFNKIVVIGKKISDNEIIVDYMESVPKENIFDSYLQHHSKGETDYGLNMFIVPRCRIKEVNLQITNDNKRRSEVVVDIREKEKDKNIKTMHFLIYGFNEENNESLNPEIYIFIISSLPKAVNKQFNMKKVDAYYVRANQLRN